ncbi:septal ring lytic transglycosylase RlpA family protein [Pontixanthobacter sp.]|uniref:septal ring lytic transglycosylase RlpA family protein n=1 Tax=Pontixanthobacter sp. TaxID=2792078 RepID=UPI003C7D5586
MDKTSRKVSIAAFTLLAAAVGGTAFADTGANDSAGAANSVDAISFTDEFETFETLPEAPEMPDHAVDISKIEPPVEIAPEVEPDARITRSLGNGVASYYGKRFHGRRTANGERFNMHAMTAAHKTLPFGTKVRVTNRRNGESVVVRINDRGPFTRGRTIDLSRAAAKEIGLISSGHARVEIDIVS